ncbi:MAG: hypothetical protein M1830_000345, partial [Pleopsidium flavum]
MPSVEVLPLMDKVLTDAPATHHYTHLPFDVRERRQSASSDEDSVVAWRKPRGPSGDVEWRHYARAERESLNTSWKSTTGKQSRFSGLFNQSISDSSNSKESTAMSELGQQCQSSALRQVADISKLDFWWNTQLQSGIEPVTSFMSTGNIGNTNAHECLPQKLLAKPGALANPSSIPAS